MSRLEAGTVVGDRYEILSLLKSGGMGAVYQARDVRGGPVVALKEMLQSFSYEVDRQLIYKKFEEEARLLETLNHNSIPRVLAHFARGDVYYIVMEYIEGESLEQLLEDYLTLTRRPMPAPLVVECALLLCPILTYLHTRQPRPIIHRDLKPGNIILRKSRTEVVLVDFGLARDISATNTQSPKTMVGTLGYAPLEQLRGQPEIRSDLYALGVTIHHLVSGRVPKLFELASLQSIMPELPADLIALVDKATQEDPSKRFQSAAEMETALSQILASGKPMPKLSMARSLVNPGRPTGHIPKPNRMTSRIASPKEMPKVDTSRLSPDGRFSTQDDSEPEVGQAPPSLPPIRPSGSPAAPDPTLSRRNPAGWRMLLPVGVVAVFVGGLWAGMMWGSRHEGPALVVPSVTATTPVAVDSTVAPVASPSVAASSTGLSLPADEATAPDGLLAPAMREPLSWKWQVEEGVQGRDSGTWLQADSHRLGKVVFTTDPAMTSPVKVLSFELHADSGTAPFLVWVGNCGVLVDPAAAQDTPSVMVLQWNGDDTPVNSLEDGLKRSAAPGTSTNRLPEAMDLKFNLRPTARGLTLDVDRVPYRAPFVMLSESPLESSSPVESTSESTAPEASSSPLASASPTGTAGEASASPGTLVLEAEVHPEKPWTSGPMGIRVLGVAPNPLFLSDLYTDPH